MENPRGTNKGWHPHGQDTAFDALSRPMDYAAWQARQEIIKREAAAKPDSLVFTPEGLVMPEATGALPTEHPEISEAI